MCHVCGVIHHSNNWFYAKYIDWIIPLTALPGVAWSRQKSEVEVIHRNFLNFIHEFRRRRRRRWCRWWWCKWIMWRVVGVCFDYGWLWCSSLAFHPWPGHSTFHSRSPKHADWILFYFAVFHFHATPVNSITTHWGAIDTKTSNLSIACQPIMCVVCFIASNGSHVCILWLNVATSVR